ncbi:hypothetical protein Angca_001982, partial [Angiostrongylus cantonensis]
SWNLVHFDINPCYVLTVGPPFIVQLKIDLTFLTIYIAAKRILALSFPILFLELSSHSYALFILLSGCFLGVFDLILEFPPSKIKNVPSYATFGCFLSRSYRYYRGVSNMVRFFYLIL